MKRPKFTVLVPYTLLFVLLFGLTAWKSIGDQPIFDSVETSYENTNTTWQGDDASETNLAVDNIHLFSVEENVRSSSHKPSGMAVYQVPLSQSSVFLLEFNNLLPSVLGISEAIPVEMDIAPATAKNLESKGLNMESTSSLVWPLEVSMNSNLGDFPAEEERLLLWNQIKHFMSQDPLGWIRDSMFVYSAGLLYNPRLSASKIKYVSQSRSNLTADDKFKFVSYPDPNNWLKDDFYILVPDSYNSRKLDKGALSKSFGGRDCLIYTCSDRRGKYKKPVLSKGEQSLGCPSGTSLRKLSTKEPLFTGDKKSIVVLPRYK